MAEIPLKCKILGVASLSRGRACERRQGARSVVSRGRDSRSERAFAQRELRDAVFLVAEQGYRCGDGLHRLTPA